MNILDERMIKIYLTFNNCIGFFFRSILKEALSFLQI